MGSAGRICSDCDGLQSGTRSWPLPHEYLLSNGPGAYRCLICDSHMTCEPVGEATRWVKTTNTGPSDQA
jgi:hypothetical protein